MFIDTSGFFEIKPPITDPAPYRREPIKIKGKALSETIIEDRR